MASVLHKDSAVEVLSGGKLVSLFILEAMVSHKISIPEKHTIFLFLFVDSIGVSLAVIAGVVSAPGAMMGRLKIVMAEKN